MSATVYSFTRNREAIQVTQASLDTLASAGPLVDKALALDTIQKQLATLDHRQENGAPWLTRFGLNVDAPLREALWPQYGIASHAVLLEPWQRTLEQRLKVLSGRGHGELAAQGDAAVKAGYADLKTYLMLAQPEHVDPAFLVDALERLNAPARPKASALTGGTWNDLRHRLTAFHVAHLAGPPIAGADLGINPRQRLIQSARQTLIGVIGLQNATDAVYQAVMEEAASRFAPVTLAGLLGDHGSQGVFDTRSTLPGVFTRTAWDEYVGKAIDQAATSRSAGTDWVVTDPRSATETATKNDLHDGLRQRYFSDYALAWQRFLNSIRWQPDRQLTGTVDQLSLLGDPQRSPLSALFRAVAWHAQAGSTMPAAASDSLLGKAQQMVTGKRDNVADMTAHITKAPLAEAFAPLLRLAPATGNPLAQEAPGDLTLARYMERLTGTRLALEQVVASPDPDAQARVLAQAILQGRTSALAESLDYGRRTAASLGSQWATFGDTMFRRPLEQSWEVVLAPTAANLNATWQTAVVGTWKGSFDGRYPFADSDNDASLPALARFLRQDTGVVQRFVQTQLAGVIEKHGDTWRPVQATTAGQGLTVDPAFIDALNTLESVSATLFASGDARAAFELRAVPTPGIQEMTVRLDAHKLHYFNQRETWVPFVWPGNALDNRTSVDWQTTTAGLRTDLAYEGRFGLIRLLEQAKVEPQDEARSLLTWTPDISTGTNLRVEMRAETGKGPLAVLALRHFVLPSRIFVTKEGAAE